MNTFLIDTDILIDFFKNRPYAVSLLTQLRSEGTIALSILSVSELCAGWNEQERDFFLPRLYASFQKKYLTDAIAERAGAFRHRFASGGKTLPSIDTLIAATAIIEGCMLVTHNTKDYPMPELSLYRWGN